MVNGKQTKLSDILNGNKKTIITTVKNESEYNIHKKRNIPDNIVNSDDDVSGEEKKQNSGRLSKECQFKEERKKLLDTLLDILDINKTNTIFYIEDINNSEAKQQKILLLVEDIKKYFAYGNWVYFCKRNVTDPCVSLSKSILKDMDVKITTVTIRDNDTKTILKHGFRLHI